MNMYMSYDGQADFRQVYHGFDPQLAGMLARILEVEGITCRHVGTHFPAADGPSGCEQRLEVPVAEAPRARELIASTGAATD
ncbi:MAG: putative prokaryotic signal transducing protein [Pseudomonadota bacterium]